ncbi:MAG: ABC transporter permease [Proteobacteria bacterium]|nr:ABC transporter permease [Pseudomonadota bacterium]
MSGPDRRPPLAAFSWRRVAAMVLRHVYLFRRSWPRLVELAYWPTVQMLTWGFINAFFRAHSSWVAQAAGVLLGAALLWDILFRSQISLALSFLEEMYARHLGHLFVSPLRVYELIVSLIAMSLIRTAIGMAPAIALAYVLYRYNLFELGLALIAFFASLFVTGWSIALFVCALVLRFGLGAESLAWAVMFAITPVTGVYYPIDSLPGWVQPISWSIPSSYVFEGMRAVMFEGVFRADLLAAATALNLVYLAVGAGVFLAAFHVARKKGLLLNVGE